MKPKSYKREILLISQIIIIAVIALQVWNYTSNWFIRNRFRHFKVEARSKSLSFILRPREMIWTKWYSKLIEVTIPEGNKILFVRDLELDGKKFPKEKYLYLFMQTYVNKSYRFHYEMFQPISGKQELIKYMKDNDFKYWVVFVKKGDRPDNESVMEIYYLEDDELNLIAKHG